MQLFCKFYSSKTPQKNPQKYKATQLFSMLIIIRNVSWAPNQHIKMISEASHDTGVIAAENSALPTKEGITF